ASFVRSEFQFTVLPKYTQVYEGESVVFQCRAFFDDEIDFSWTLNGNPIRLDRRVYLNGSNLHINGVSQRLDSGDYVCLATARSSGARVATPPAKLDIIQTFGNFLDNRNGKTSKAFLSIMICFWEQIMREGLEAADIPTDIQTASRAALEYCYSNQKRTIFNKQGCRKLKLKTETFVVHAPHEKIYSAFGINMRNIGWSCRTIS
ncbi:uncharacterized protein LOC134202911, partial [Armigeres subalbatus]|uniref:uncharacterized protein LOC134202911 n=1 Tax=Armigeres subalbatus TaxID=124917 RepID=UPI002ED2862A